MPLVPCQLSAPGPGGIPEVFGVISEMLIFFIPNKRSLNQWLIHQRSAFPSFLSLRKKRGFHILMKKMMSFSMLQSTHGSCHLYWCWTYRLFAWQVINVSELWSLSPKVAGLSNPGRNRADNPRYLSIIDCLATRYKDLVDHNVSFLNMNYIITRSQTRKWQLREKSPGKQTYLAHWTPHLVIT